MKQELKYTLETEKDGKIYGFIMQGDADLGAACDVCIDFYSILKDNFEKREKKLRDLEEQRKKKIEESKEVKVEKIEEKK